jgi:hypothetical protein
MGMQTTDDEEQIAREHSAEETYRRIYPWRAPKSDASEDERAFYHAEVREWMEGRRR